MPDPQTNSTTDAQLAGISLSAYLIQDNAKQRSYNVIFKIYCIVNKNS